MNYHIIQAHPYSYYGYTHNYQYCNATMASWKFANSYKFRIIFLESMDKKSDFDVQVTVHHDKFL